MELSSLDISDRRTYLQKYSPRYEEYEVAHYEIQKRRKLDNTEHTMFSSYRSERSKDWIEGT